VKPISLRLPAPKRLFYFIDGIVFGLLSLLITGCAHIPTQEFSEYRSAFAEVQVVSEAVLIDFAAATEAAESRTNKHTSRVLFSTELNGTDDTPTAVEVRRATLRAIERFNNVLTTLAEGKSVGELQNAAGGFVEAAGNFIAAASQGAPVPGLSSIVGIVKTLTGELEKARLRKEFKKAVRNGAPIIEKMLIALIDERSDHIILRADEANLRHIRILADTTQSIQNVRDLFKARVNPPADDPRQEIEEALNAALLPMTNAFNFSLPVELKYSASTNDMLFTAEQKVVAQQAIGRIGKLVTDYEANVLQFKKLKDALNGYGSMLQRTSMTLKALVNALDRPQNFESSSEELFQIAFSIKRDIDAYKLARQLSQ